MQAECVYNVRVSTHVKRRPRKEPIWELRIRTGGRDTTRTIGKAWIDVELWAKKAQVRHLQSRPKAGYLTRSQAEVAAQEIVNQESAFVPDDIKTFGRACEEYLEHAEHEKGLRGSTLHGYRQIATRLSKRPWKQGTWVDRPLNTFTETDLLDLRAEMKAAGLAAHTVNQARSVLRGVFGERPVIQAWKWMAVRKRESTGKISFYTPAEVARLIEHAASDVDAAVYTLASEQGLRISEIRGLKVGQVDFEAGIIRIEDGYTTTGGHAGTKGHRVRSLPLTAHTRHWVWPFCAHRSTFNEDGSQALLFAEADGRPIEYYAVRKRFERARKAAGLHRITFHELRHTFGTQMVRHVDIYTLQRLMGHEKISTTEIYLHYRPDPNLGEVMSAIWDQPGAEVISLRKAS